MVTVLGTGTVCIPTGLGWGGGWILGLLVWQDQASCPRASVFWCLQGSLWSPEGMIGLSLPQGGAAVLREPLGWHQEVRGGGGWDVLICGGARRGKDPRWA